MFYCQSLLLDLDKQMKDSQICATICTSGINENNKMEKAAQYIKPFQFLYSSDSSIIAAFKQLKQLLNLFSKDFPEIIYLKLWRVSKSTSIINFQINLTAPIIFLLCFTNIIKRSVGLNLWIIFVLLFCVIAILSHLFQQPPLHPQLILHFLNWLLQLLPLLPY